MTQYRIAWLALLAFSVGCAPAGQDQAPASAAALGTVPQPTTVFVVRHAEKESGDDPALNAAGEERSQLLARMLSHAEVGGLYASQFRRTQDTLKPAADRMGLTTVVIDARDIQGLLDRIRRDHPGGRVAVASHSNIVPAILGAAGITGAPEISEDQYDDFFILTLEEEGARVIRLKYGKECPCG